jgi:hypothetical protein
LPLIAGTSGSKISGSFNLHKKRSVHPRTHSFGCFKSFKIALLQKLKKIKKFKNKDKSKENKFKKDVRND